MNDPSEVVHSSLSLARPSPSARDTLPARATHAGSPSTPADSLDRHLYCPTCSARLFNRSCKWWCPTCGYHESCADG